MSKYMNCGEHCCHTPECCPRGFREHVQHYLYLRQHTPITFIGYWWHETKSLFGGNKADPEGFEDES